MFISKIKKRLSKFLKYPVTPKLILRIVIILVLICSIFWVGYQFAVYQSNHGGFKLPHFNTPNCSPVNPVSSYLEGSPTVFPYNGAPSNTNQNCQNSNINQFSSN